MATIRDNNNLYMDDCLKSLPSEEEAIQMAKDLVDLSQIGMQRLTGFTINRALKRHG